MQGQHIIYFILFYFLLLFYLLLLFFFFKRIEKVCKKWKPLVWKSLTEIHSHIGWKNDNTLKKILDKSPFLRHIFLSSSITLDEFQRILLFTNLESLSFSLKTPLNSINSSITSNLGLSSFSKLKYLDCYLSSVIESNEIVMLTNLQSLKLRNAGHYPGYSLTLLGKLSKLTSLEVPSDTVFQNDLLFNLKKLKKLSISSDVTYSTSNTYDFAILPCLEDFSSHSSLPYPIFIKLLQHTTLRNLKLNLRGINLDLKNNEFHFISNLKVIENLSLSFYDRTLSHQQISSLAVLTTLKKLHLIGGNIEIDETNEESLNIYKKFNLMTRLEDLEMTFNQQIIKRFFDFSNFNNDIIQQQQQQQQEQEQEQLYSLSRLTSLCLRKCNFFTEDYFDLVGKLHSLKFLYIIDFDQLKDEKVYSKLEKLTLLTELRLWHSFTHCKKPPGVKELSVLTQLLNLSIGYPINNENIQELKPLKKLTSFYVYSRADAFNVLTELQKI